MSRIEKALEKAAQLRGDDGTQKRSGQRDVRYQHAPRQTVGTTPIDDPYLVAFRDPASPASEEYKKLKSRIVMLTKQESFKNTLLVTSAVGGEGKSITAANLALSLSQDYDHSVLLVDADVRKPSLSKLFNVKTGIGLSDCIEDDRDIGSALIKLGNGNLTFLPSGKRPDNAVELFSSQRMQRTLGALKYRYPDRYIIIDTPPVLLFAETKMISSFVDGIIFVIKEGRAPLKYIDEALDALKDENIMGVVYNGAGPNNLTGRYAYHSYYLDYQKK
jgi:protein-tyrosine kinase